MAVVTTLTFSFSGRITTLGGASFFSVIGTSAMPWPQPTKAICEATERTSCKITDLGRDGLAASAILAGKRGFCLHKAIAFVAVCRAAGLSARLLADKVKNHVTTTELSALVGGQDFLHWFAEVRVDNVWLQVSPTFNKQMCQLFGMRPLAFDGKTHAVQQHYGGELFMEYLGKPVTFADPSHDELQAYIAAHHPRMVTADRIVPKKSAFGASRTSIDHMEVN